MSHDSAFHQQSRGQRRIASILALRKKTLDDILQRRDRVAVDIASLKQELDVNRDELEMVDQTLAAPSLTVQRLISYQHYRGQLRARRQDLESSLATLSAEHTQLGQQVTTARQRVQALDRWQQRRTSMVTALNLKREQHLVDELAQCAVNRP